MIGEITTRAALKPGDCFEYVDYPGNPHFAGKKIVVAFEKRRPRDLPREWGWSGDQVLEERGAWRVRRIKPWWSGKDDEPTVQPTILPCVGPMDGFHALCVTRVGGLSGLDCLKLYEQAMQAEGVQRDAAGKRVTDDLTATQVELAQSVWQAKLRGQVAIAKAAAAAAERARVICDPVDEMPNLADA